MDIQAQPFKMVKLDSDLIESVGQTLVGRV